MIEDLLRRIEKVTDDVFRYSIKEMKFTRQSDGRLILNTPDGGGGQLLSDPEDKYTSVILWLPPEEGGRIDTHWHPTPPGMNETVIMIKGSGEILETGEKIEANTSKTQAAFPASVPHTIEFTPGAELLVIFRPAHPIKIVEQGDES